jgi:hypothetical protein
MSRYEVPFDDCHEVFVGWDEALHTFFAQVCPAEDDDDCDDDDLLLWVGTTPAEITSVSHLAYRLSKFAAIPLDVMRDLEADQAA